MPNLKDHIKNNSTLHYLFFWLLIFIAFIIFDKSTVPFYLVIGQELINVTLLALLISFNFVYLIPRFLSQRSLLVYSIALVLSCLVLTPIKTTMLYFLFGDYPLEQSLILNSQRLFFAANLVITSASTFFKIIADWVTLSREKKELHTRTIQSELKFLKAQINPHFLFNTLNNLYALTLKKSDDAPTTVLKLSEMMRYMLYECNESHVPLSKEISYIQNYIDLEKIRQHQNFDIQLNIKGNPGTLQIAPMIFVPFIENSFKHGINHLIRDGKVHIDIKTDGNELNFTIVNTKPEKKVAPKSLSGGIGLDNVKKRLKLLYPKAYKLNIEDRSTEYYVHLNIILN